MEWVDVDFGALDEHGSFGVVLTELSRLSESGEFRAHVADFSGPAVLGRHPGHLWQMFAVVRGEGWVSGDDTTRVPIAAGQSVLWRPGESHESGTESAMLAVIVESSVRPVV